MKFLSPGTVLKLSFTQVYSVILTAIFATGSFYVWKDKVSENRRLSQEKEIQFQKSDSIQMTMINILTKKAQQKDSIEEITKLIYQQSITTNNNLIIANNNIRELARTLNRIDIIESYIPKNSFNDTILKKKFHSNQSLMSIN